MAFFGEPFFPFVSTQKKIRGTLLEKKGGSRGGSVYREKKDPKEKLERKSLRKSFKGFPKKKRRAHKAKRKRKKEK
jgi:hypothetical protein